jgi:hypothetical protein
MNPEVKERPVPEMLVVEALERIFDTVFLSYLV